MNTITLKQGLHDLNPSEGPLLGCPSHRPGYHPKSRTFDCSILSRCDISALKKEVDSTVIKKCAISRCYVCKIIVSKLPCILEEKHLVKLETRAQLSTWASGQLCITCTHAGCYIHLLPNSMSTSNRAEREPNILQFGHHHQNKNSTSSQICHTTHINQNMTTEFQQVAS